MDKPKINLKAWVPMEKRKRESTKTQESRNQHLEEKRNSSTSNSQKPVNQAMNRQHLGNDSEDLFKEKKHKEKNYIEETSTKKESYESMYGPIYIEPNEETKYNKKWYNIEIEEKLEKKPKHKKIGKSKRGVLFEKSQILKIVIASLGAITTGLVFGYVLLNYFVNPIFHSEETLNNSTNQPSAISLNHNNAGLVINADTQVIPSSQIYLLQAGVFSDNKGAESVHTEQRELGRAAVISGQGPYSVFVGISTDKDLGNKLKDLLLEEGNDLYLKEYTVPEYKSAMSKESFTIFSKWMIVGEELIQSLSNETINALTNPKHTLNYDAIQQLHQKYLIEAQEMKTALAQEGLSQESTSTQRMLEQINYSIAALNAYKKNPNDQYLWNIQELLIKYKMSYEELAKR